MSSPNRINALLSPAALAAAPDVDPRDVETFEQALGSGSVGAMVAAFAGGHAARTRRVERDLLRAAKTGDADRLLKLNRQYSAVMLEQAFAMKILGKTTQAVDGLTKLQ